MDAAGLEPTFCGVRSPGLTYLARYIHSGMITALKEFSLLQSAKVPWKALAAVPYSTACLSFDYNYTSLITFPP